MTKENNNSGLCTGLNSSDLNNFRKLILKSFKVLNKKNFSIIIHGASFPSLEKQDTGIGSPNSEGAKLFISFINNLGFNSIQLGPWGKTKIVDASPYTSTIFSSNTLFIDLAPLTGEKWGKILSNETFERIVNNNPNKNSNKAAYVYVFNEQENAILEAFSTFNEKLANLSNLDKKESNKIELLKEKFSKFKKENNYWLEKDALYEALSKKYNNDYWPMWSEDVDKNLFNTRDKNDELTSKLRIGELKKEYKNEIELYKFTQFIADAQKEEIKEYALENGIKLIADRQVGFSDRDIWANQSLFLRGWYLGCPPDYFSEDGQAWGFPVLDPEKLFNKNGSLGKGGQLLKAVFNKIFKENPGGVRIDHIIGLIDPWVYTDSPKRGSRLYSSPEREDLAKYARISNEDLNFSEEPEADIRVKHVSKAQVKKYAEFITKIIIKAAEEEGLSKDSIICEDLGSLTNPVYKVMEDLELSGMRVTQFVDPQDFEHPYRCSNMTEQHWAVTGTHDNETIASWVESLYKQPEILEKHIQNLAQDLIVEEEKREEFINSLRNNPKEFIKAKYVELFVSKSENVQVFFTDFFGINERYNKPGTSGSENWSLRLPNNFCEVYFNNLSKGDGLNLAKVLKLAIEYKGSKFAEKNKNLIKELDEFANKLN